MAEEGNARKNVETSESASAAQEGVMSTFEKLVERHRNSVYSLALLVTGSQACALEVSQMTFLSAHSHLNEFRSEAEFGAWVRRIAARLTMRPSETSLEEPNSRNLNEGGASEKRVPAKWSQCGGQQAMSAELRQAIWRATQQLPKEQREVLLLRDLAGLTYGEIAEISRNSVAAIKRCLHQARLRVCETIASCYV
jgi:RNA polymerase sigma-70 factor, ECF subfamily